MRLLLSLILLIQLQCFTVAVDEPEWVHNIPLDLNVDSQLSILETIELNDMIEIADSSDHFKMLSSIIFKRKYSKETFYIDCSFQTMGGFDFFADLYIKPEFVEILSLKIAKKFLKNFGKFISNLYLDYSKCQNDDEKHILSELINANCVDTLKELRLFVKAMYTERFFDQFPRAFRNIEVLHLSGLYGSLDGSNLTFTEMFPSLRYLILKSIFIHNKSFAKQNLPHLRRVDFDISFYSNLGTFNTAETFFRNNPQIQEMKLKRSDQKLLRCVADELRQIDSLTLDDHFQQIAISNDTIRFDNVRKFVWINADFMVPDRIVFTNLIEFESDGGSRKGSNFIDFFRNSSDTLTKLHLNRRSIEREELNDLSEVNRNWVEFSVILRIDIDPESLFRFVEKGENLQKIYFEFSFVDDGNQGKYNEIQKILRERLPIYWRISTNQRKFAISLRR